MQATQILLESNGKLWRSVINLSQIMHERVDAIQCCEYLYY